MSTRTALFCALFPLVASGCDEAVPPAPPPPQVGVVDVTIEDVPIYMESVGETLGSLDIAIRARVEGTIDKVHFEEGLHIEKGALLYTIDPSPFTAKVLEAQGKLAEANARYVQADSDLKRIRPLVKIDALSKRTLDAAIAEFDATKGLVTVAEAMVTNAKIDLGYTEIKAPLSGLIGVSEAYQGDFVGRYPNPVVLTTISQLDPIKVRFSISERDYVNFIRKHGATPKSRGERDPEREKETDLTLYLVDGYRHPHTGAINFAGREIDKATGTLMIEAEFPNPDKTVRPGQFARIRATTEIAKGAVLVPQRSVIELQELYQVYVVEKDNVARVRQVTPGVRVGELWLIEKGLEAGDRVVVSGLHLVKPGQPVRPVAPQTAGGEQKEPGK